MQRSELPRVLICGLSKSGKTSIIKVVFDKLQPHETMFLDSTLRTEAVLANRNDLLKFRAVDCPSSTSVEDPELNDLPKNCALVFVIDAQQEPYSEALSLARQYMESTFAKQPDINIHFLIHKVDGDKFFSEEIRSEILRDVRSKLSQELSDTQIGREIKYHCTSIYDHTIFETFSKIVQGVIPRLSVVEECIDTLALNSRMEKAFLFDMVTKMFIAEDSQRVFTQAYEICADMIDVVIDVCSIYGENGETTNSSSVINLGDQYVLYHREVEKCLALVCILRLDHFDRRHLLDYNISVFQEVLRSIMTSPDF